MSAPACGRMPYALASGKKDYGKPGSAKNRIRRDPLAGGCLMRLRPVRKIMASQDQRKIA